MPTKSNNPAAAAVISGDQLMAKTHNLPLPIVQVLSEIASATGKLQGSIQKLSKTLSNALGEDWYTYEAGDPSEDAAPVHEMKTKILAYYEEQLGHSNGAAVWREARKYAKSEATKDEEGEDKGANANKPADTFTHLIGNGSYELGKNKGAAVKMYRRIALDTKGKTANPALKVFQDKLAEGLSALGFDTSKLKGKEPKL